MSHPADPQSISLVFGLGPPFEALAVTGTREDPIFELRLLGETPSGEPGTFESARVQLSSPKLVLFARTLLRVVQIVSGEGEVSGQPGGGVAGAERRCGAEEAAAMTQALLEGTLDLGVHGVARETETPHGVRSSCGGPSRAPQQWWREHRRVGTLLVPARSSVR